MNIKLNIKNKIPNIKNRYAKILKFLICVFNFWFLIFGFIGCVYAQEFTILYTGDTHAMIYPCSCPKDPDGGIARRATLIKQLRAKFPDALLLDSGGFFAGGLMDEYTQNTKFDSDRTIVNLKAMELMKYDAVALGDDEFNFGRQFFQDNIKKTNLTFLSCNVKSEKVLPYTMKNVLGVKIGIVGVTSLLASQKAGDLKFSDPKPAVAEAVGYLRNNGADIILLLSHLGESEDLNLIRDIEGIDVLIIGHSRTNEQPAAKIAKTLVLRPSWQGRKLGRVTFTLQDRKITDYKVEELRLSDQIADDPAILSILPHCFSDNNCRREGSVGTCQNPGTINSRCLFTEANKVNLLIITSKDCITCNTERVVNSLKGSFPGLVVAYLYYPDKRADELFRGLGIPGLPAYLLDKATEKEKSFDALKENLELKGDFYMLKPQFSGLTYLPNRKKVKGKLDIFFSLFAENSRGLLDVTREFNPDLHFLGIEQEGKFSAPGGHLEVEEYKRALCVQKYYPQIFWDYISCREKSIASSWWEDCAVNLDVNKIKSCAKGDEGVLLLRENTSLNNELGVMVGPAYLLDNQEIFSSNGVPSKEELRGVIKR